LIEEGDPASKNELIEALNIFGDKDMAQDYLNSGNLWLESAGREWGEQHGYGVAKSGADSHSVKWGRAR
jgi:hypothetical protein